MDISPELIKIFSEFGATGLMAMVFYLVVRMQTASHGKAIDRMGEAFDRITEILGDLRDEVRRAWPK